MRSALCLVFFVFCVIGGAFAGDSGRSYSVEEAVQTALAQNPDVAVARKKLEAANGGLIQAKSGYYPSVVSTGLFREREQQKDSRLRDEDYNASVRAVQSLYSGGAVRAQVAIARLNIEKQQLELDAVTNRVSMDVRIACNELLLNRSRIKVHEQSLSVFEEELKTQQERFVAGTVGQLNVSRAQVAFSTEQPILIDAQTQLKTSQLHLAELLGVDTGAKAHNHDGVDATGQLQFRPLRPDLNECLARADTERPEIRAREIDVEIEKLQEQVDMAELRPQVEAFTGYEVYNERDPELGQEFNHGYVVGVNAKWHIFDGFATKGKVIATRARRDAAAQLLEATKLSVASEVRSAFLDLQQAERTLQSETKNVQTADESLEIAKANAGAGLSTQLDVLQAAADVTRTRTTRLSAIYLHNVAIARLARACAVSPNDLEKSTKLGARRSKEQPGSRAADIARPPARLTQQ